jgi:PPOX class probable F420-dependent enzyme
MLPVPAAAVQQTAQMPLDPLALPQEAEAFVAERHLATLTVLRPDGTPHVAPVGFTWDADTGLVRIITFASALKVQHLTRRPHPRAAVCQVDGGRWLTFEGPATVTDDPARVAEAVKRYAVRYRQPGDRPDRVAVEITVDRILGRP